MRPIVTDREEKRLLAIAQFPEFFDSPIRLCSVVIGIVRYFRRASRSSSLRSAAHQGDSTRQKARGSASAVSSKIEAGGEPEVAETNEIRETP